MLAFWVGMEKNGGMRGTPVRLLSSLSTEDLIPADHPIRRIRVVVDTVLGERRLVRCDVREIGSAVGATRDAVEGVGVDGDVFDAF